MLIPNDQVNIFNTSSVMIIFILLFLLTKSQFIVLSAQRIGTDKLLSTQFDSNYFSLYHHFYAQ